MDSESFFVADDDGEELVTFLEFEHGRPGYLSDAAAGGLTPTRTAAPARGLMPGRRYSSGHDR